jgi:hypothetical protein
VSAPSPDHSHQVPVINSRKPTIRSNKLKACSILQCCNTLRKSRSAELRSSIPNVPGWAPNPRLVDRLPVRLIRSLCKGRPGGSMALVNKSLLPYPEENLSWRCSSGICRTPNAIVGVRL